MGDNIVVTAFSSTGSRPVQVINPAPPALLWLVLFNMEGVMNGCELKKCRFWDGKKCNDNNDWISAENGETCCGLRSDAVLVDKEKRKPLADGTLELTDEEMEEFFLLTGRANDGKYPIYFLKNVYIEDNAVYASMFRRGENYEKFSGCILISNFKAILYLAELFKLGGE